LPPPSPAIHHHHVAPVRNAATVKNLARAGVGPLVAFVVAGGAALCAGCVPDALVQRASNEFACPQQRIEVIDRRDIAAGLYDVDACGSRARYMCFQTGRGGRTMGGACVHEPDPPRWDPDPTLVASLPRPPGMSGDGRLARICPRNESPEDDCLTMEGGAWHWYHWVYVRQPGGLGAPGM
jgi:hypothetical protein